METKIKTKTKHSIFTALHCTAPPLHTTHYTCCCFCYFACDTIYLVDLFFFLWSALFQIFLLSFYCFLAATLLILFLCCPYSLTSLLLLLLAIACHIVFFIVAPSCCLPAALHLQYSCTMRSIFYSYFFSASLLHQFFLAWFYIEVLNLFKFITVYQCNYVDMTCFFDIHCKNKYEKHFRILI